MVERTAPRLKMNIRKRTISILISTFVILLVMNGTGIFIDPEKISIHLTEKNQAPSLSHLFGTDWLGRDMLLRTLKGLTLSFGVGVLAAFTSTVIALLLSILSSWSNVADTIVTWLIDLFLSVPHLITLILISFAAGGGFKGVVIGLALTHWPSLTRLLRGEMLQIKSADYVSISRRLGKSRFWIARHHFIPHLLLQLFVGFV